MQNEPWANKSLSSEKVVNLFHIAKTFLKQSFERLKFN